MSDDDKLLIVPLGDESKIITQTIASDTARKVLELLAESPMSTSTVAKRLEIPLTTAQYNIEKLIEAGLVIVDKTKYSEKGREVKLYTPARRMIVLVPKSSSNQSVMDALKKYLMLLPIAAFISLLIEAAMQLNGLSSRSPAASPEAAVNGSAPASATVNEIRTAVANNSSWDSVAKGMPPTSAAAPTSAAGAPSAGYSWFNGTDITPSAGPAPSYMTASNSTTGQDSFTAAANASNSQASTPLGNEHGMPSIEPTATTPTVPQHTDSGTILGIIPSDLLNHWSLWFFIGCLLIIGILITYELYKRHKSMKK